MGQWLWKNMRICMTCYNCGKKIEEKINNSLKGTWQRACVYQTMELIQGRNQKND